MLIDKKREVRFLQRESVLLKALSTLIFRLGNELPILLKISITGIKLTKDRSRATVFIYSSFGENIVEESIKELIPYIPSIKASLPALAQLRRVPEIRLVYDKQRDKINHIEELLDSVKEEKENV